MVAEPGANENKCFAKLSGPAGLMEYSSSETGEMEAPLQVVMGKLMTSTSLNDMREEGVYWNYRRK